MDNINGKLPVMQFWFWKVFSSFKTKPLSQSFTIVLKDTLFIMTKPLKPIIYDCSKGSTFHHKSQGMAHMSYTDTALNTFQNVKLSDFYQVHMESICQVCSLW